MKRIGLIDADLMDNGTRHPNLALMKIAGYHKKAGNEVSLIYKSYNEVKDFDEIFISKVFTFTILPDWVLALPNVKIGGTGFFQDGGENLPDEIEHHMPFYDLYKPYVDEQISKGRKRQQFSDYLDYSIGFTTRGCFRKCSFCVNKKYDGATKHSPVEEFFDETRPYIYLWDDNILAFPEWKKILDDLEKTGRQFQFRQGIDLRLMTEEKAWRFNNIHYQGDFIFAFDHIKDRDEISEKVQLWKRYSSRVCKMYVLCAFDSQDEKDIETVFERISILMKYGSLPYIMRYEDYKNSYYRGMYVELARWCNQPQFFKKKSFREFCIANQEYKKDQETNCAAFQTMLDFEKEFPSIAAKYFDLKFEEENIYKKQYGYGRKYENKPNCMKCKQKGLCWDNLCNKPDTEKELLKAYFTKEIDLLCLNYNNSECSIDQKVAAAILCNILNKYTIDEIVYLIRDSSNREKVAHDNIPQYSKIDDAFYKVAKILIDSGVEYMDFNTLGYYLEKNDDVDKKKPGALKKYGENHAKLAALMDLIYIGKEGIKSEVRVTELGRVIYTLGKVEQDDLLYKLCLRIPIIQNKFIETTEIDTIERDFLILSEKTQKRRGSNVHNMVRSILERSESLVKK